MSDGKRFYKVQKGFDIRGRDIFPGSGDAVAIILPFSETVPFGSIIKTDNGAIDDIIYDGSRSMYKYVLDLNGNISNRQIDDIEQIYDRVIHNKTAFIELSPETAQQYLETQVKIITLQEQVDIRKDVIEEVVNKDDTVYSVEEKIDVIADYLKENKEFNIQIKELSEELRFLVNPNKQIEKREDVGR